MKFYEFGPQDGNSILLLPGNFATHRQFEKVVPLLEEQYHVITVDFDGYDETGETTYTTAKEQAEKLALYIRENLGGRIDLIEAESLGSVPAVYLSTDKSICVGGMILDGAQYLDYGIFNSIMMAWAPKFACNMMNKIRAKDKVEFPKFLLKITGRSNENLQDVFGMLAKDFSYETVRNTFYEGMVFYRYVAQIEPQTHIKTACWYGEHEQNMKKAIKALQRAYPNIDTHPFKGLGHGSIVDDPQRFVTEIKQFLRNCE